MPTPHQAQHRHQTSDAVLPPIDGGGSGGSADAAVVGSGAGGWANLSPQKNASLSLNQCVPLPSLSTASDSIVNEAAAATLGPPTTVTVSKDDSSTLLSPFPPATTTMEEEEDEEEEGGAGVGILIDDAACKLPLNSSTGQAADINASRLVPPNLFVLFLFFSFFFFLSLSFPS